MAHIGFDIDGVLINYVSAVRRAAGLKETDTQPQTYSMVEPGWFESEDQWLDAHNKAMVHSDAFEVLDPTADQAFDLIRSHGHEIWALTGRNSVYSGLTERSLANNGWKFDRVIHTSGLIEKSSFDLDWLLEDHPETVLEQSDTSMVIRDHPYNRQVPASIPRVYSCLEFAELVVGS